MDPRLVARLVAVSRAAADAADLAATIAMRDELPALAAANAIGVTVGGVALGLAAAAALD